MSIDNTVHEVKVNATLTMRGKVLNEITAATQAAREKAAAWLGPTSEAPSGGHIRMEFVLREDGAYTIVSSPTQDSAWEQQARDRDVSLRMVLREVAREGIDVRGPDGGVFRFTYAVKEAG